MLIACLSYLDHELAVQSAVGYVVQAAEMNECVRVCLTLALVDESEKSIDRAAQWLEHPIEEVRMKSLERLCYTPTKFRSSESEHFIGTLVYEQDNFVPGIWFSRRDLPLLH